MSDSRPRRIELVEHRIAPIYDERSAILILGTMPSPSSRAAAFYYAHPRNRFWPVMERLFDLGRGSLEDVDERRAFLAEHRIALWDVLASCTIEGASDASISNPVPNDLSVIARHAPLSSVFCTGSTAARLYRRLSEDMVGIPCTQLPSTSPANAKMGIDALVEAYRPILDALEALEREQGAEGSASPHPATNDRTAS